MTARFRGALLACLLCPTMMLALSGCGGGGKGSAGSSSTAAVNTGVSASAASGGFVSVAVASSNDLDPFAAGVQADLQVTGLPANTDFVLESAASKRGLQPQALGNARSDANGMAVFARVTFSHGLQLAIRDGLGATRVTLNVTLTVDAAAANRNPTATASSPAATVAGTTVLLSGAGADADGDSLTYQWFQIFGTPAALSGAKSASASFTPPAAGAYGFQLTVTDGRGGSATADVSLTATTPTANRAPIAQAGPSQFGVGYGTTVLLNGSRSADPNNDVVTYQWTQSSSDRVRAALQNASSSVASFVTTSLEAAFSSAKTPIPTAYDLLGVPHYAGLSYNFTLMVRDPQGLTATNTLEVVSRVHTSGTTNFGVGTVATFSSERPTPPWSWTLVSKPAASSAQLVSADTRFPFLVPDVRGLYSVREGTKSPIVISAASFVGSGGGLAGTTVPASCASCHNGKTQFPVSNASGNITTKTLDDKLTPFLQTYHPQKLKNHLDGNRGATYRTSCFKCHTTGFDQTPSAGNGGFDDVLASTGYTIPTTLKSGNHDALPAALKALSGVQCESCHGPGSDHFGNKQRIGVSLDVQVCSQCHTSQPSEWANSQKHKQLTSYPTDPTDENHNRAACAGCHSGKGYMAYADTIATTRTVQLVGSFPSTGSGVLSSTFQPFTCAVCHDPHKTSTPAPADGTFPDTRDRQLRIFNKDLKLIDGTLVTNTGSAATCMSCHHARKAASSVSTYKSGRLGAHYGVQTDMLVGTNGFTFGQTLSSSPHKFVVPGRCVTCHMTEPPDKYPGQINEAGGHTWRMTTESGKNNSQLACASCHSGLTSFDRPPTGGAKDYDGNGKAEGVQTEVKGLIKLIDSEMRKVNSAGWTKYLASEDATGLTTAQRGVGWNYLFVEDDGSHGVHNTAYAVQLLQKSYKALTGSEVPGAALR